MEIFDKPNPILHQENYYDGYEKSIAALRNDPNVIEFDKLCYEIFEMNPQGKRFLELCKERYLIPALARPGTATYQLDVMWGEGFKDFPRMILSSLQSHQNRILSGKN